MARGWHKYLGLATALLAGAVGTAPTVAQQGEERPVLTTGQALSFAGAGAVVGVSAYLSARVGPPSCAPCDPATLPWFDRWVVGVPSRTWSRTSDVVLLGLGGATLLHTGLREDGGRDVVISLESLAWTFAVTQLGKALIGRERPVMYTEQAIVVADDVNNQRSMWSGHTSAAFALATGYWLNNPDRDLAPKIAAMFAAAGIGALRVAAHKHFLSDVLVGALVGTAGAVVVYELRK